MTATMSELQKQLPAQTQLVSFSVDPQRDTPEALKKYAQTYNADPSRWHFLTGTRPQMIAVVSAMQLPFREADGNSPILHSERMVLIDGAGNVRGTYHSKNDEEMKQLISDAAALAREAHPPRAGGKP
jgi:protein SCO1/2